MEWVKVEDGLPEREEVDGHFSINVLLWGTDFVKPLEGYYYWRANDWMGESSWYIDDGEMDWRCTSTVTHWLKVTPPEKE